MNIFVQNFPFQTDEEKVRELFSEHGQVRTVRVVKDPITGKSRGFGFVEMPNAEEAQRAMAALHGANYEGRKLVVNEAKAQRVERARHRS